MKKIWPIIIIVILFFALMIFLTYRIPEINFFASGISIDRHWPLWLVGLIAPIMYLFERFGNWTKSLFSTPGVLEENKRLKTEQERTRKEVDSLIEWRSKSLTKEYEVVNQLKTDISSMKSNLNAINSKIENLRGMSDRQIAESMSEKEKDDAFDSIFESNGVTVNYKNAQ